MRPGGGLRAQRGGFGAGERGREDGKGAREDEGRGPGAARA